MVGAPWRCDRAENDSDRGPNAEVHAAEDGDGGRGKKNGDAVLDFEVDGDGVAKREEKKCDADLSEAFRYLPDGG